MTTTIWIPESTVRHGYYAMKSPKTHGYINSQGTGYSTTIQSDAMQFLSQAECQAWCDAWIADNERTGIIDRFKPRETCLSSSSVIYSEIRNERTRQDKKWGGPDHDNNHSLSDWNRFIDHQQHEATYEPTLDDVRYRLIKIGALAVAAVESIDRKHGDHYAK